MGISGAVDRIPNRDFFRSLENRPGGETLTLPGGPFRCRLSGLPAELVPRLEGRWRTLAGEELAEPAGEVRLVAVEAGVDSFLSRPPLAERPEEYRFGYANEGGEHLCWSYHFALRFNPATGSGKLALCRLDSPHLEGIIENTLRVVFAWQAVAAGGFLIHSSGVQRNGKHHIFFGPSGSGKTTLSKLCPPEDVLHDDLCVIVPGKTGFLATGFPFLGDDRKDLPLRQALRPVAGFYRLVQSEAVGLERLRAAVATAEVMGSLPFVSDHPETGESALGNVGRMVKSVPVFRLAFRKDLTFWEAIDRNGGRPE